jgi:hypothetical protein
MKPVVTKHTELAGFSPSVRSGREWKKPSNFAGGGVHSFGHATGLWCIRRPSRKNFGVFAPERKMRSKGQGLRGFGDEHEGSLGRNNHGEFRSHLSAGCET